MYNYICDDLNRTGAKWSTAELKCAARRDDVDTGSPEKEHQADSHDCTIMRSCRQSHAEFAIVLYGRPLQIMARPDKHTPPITASYAHLFRQVLFMGIPMCAWYSRHRDDWCKHKLHTTILHILEIGTSLLDRFPNTNCIRLTVTDGTWARLQYPGVRIRS